ncbi:MAG TPA: Tol-Pal system beta propeller repeat protein TolB [Geminicoccus sp.]|jgi:TolB protein|uniref:Tol-Pal system beta propeller repeat protein TolB n=1 Tax=Geminicoccus sp. TaxID=2024832 RepID=UPI002E36DCA0|nr:Tol-Pal system beta propeller repeat protein TolB [Geminicoccus sp.]HEX2528093.1 Tol-Pal system beta propeller repeat protein TolB [Geminicoccus sp.]
MDEVIGAGGDAGEQLDVRPLVGRRGFLSGSAAALATCLANPAMAQLTVDITGGVTQPIPVAVSPFASAGSQASQLSNQMAEVVAADLQNSGLFEIIDRRAYIQSPEELRGVPRFADWRQINAQALVTGVVTQTASGLSVEYRLWDVLAGTQMHGMQLGGPANIWRRFSHKIADQVYERITGEKGYFDTKIVYVSETGPKTKRTYRLAVMDQDGANHRFITDGGNEVLGPRFSRDVRRVAYLSYKGLRPRVYIRDIDGGREQVLLDTAGMNFAPRFSPDGRTALVTVSDDGNFNIFAVNLQTRARRAVTTGTGISTSPSFSPDGSRIVFNSDRSGRPHLFVTGIGGGTAERISYGDGQYGSPAWSPRGDLITFVNIKQRYFHIGVMRPDGSDERLITRSFQDEAPSWAPNGRVILFQRTEPGGTAKRLYAIDVSGYNERPIPTPLDASDPDWSPLLP